MTVCFNKQVKESDVKKVRELCEKHKLKSLQLGTEQPAEKLKQLLNQ